jgi:CHAT domain-containing protein
VTPFAPGASAAGDPSDLLAHGACAAAQRAAAGTLANAEATRRGATIADALALRSRIALECQRPDTPGLDEWLERELRLRTRLGQTGSAAIAGVRLQQARKALQQYHLEEASAKLRALDREAAERKWPPGLRARIANQLAALHNARADTVATLAASDHAISLARAAHDDESLMLGFRNRCQALTRQRNGAEALVAIAQAERVARARFGDHSMQLADILRTGARAAREAGDHGAAIDALEQALTIQRGQAEPDQREIATTLLVLGQSLKISGDKPRAGRVYEQALAADKLDPDPTGRTRAITLHGLANLERDLGHNERAITLYAEAEPVFARNFGAQSTALAQVLNNHANAEANIGHLDAAKALYQRALDIAHARDSTDPADYLPQTNLAMVQVWQGLFAGAEPGFRASIARLRNTSAGSETSSLLPSMGLAASLWGQQRLDEAFDQAVAAEQTRQAALRLAASHLGERQAVNLQEYLRPTLDQVISIAVASGKPAYLERAWELGMAARDQLTGIRAQRLASARGSDDPKLAALWQAWREASAALARSELSSSGAAAKREAQVTLDRAERMLARATPLAGALAGTRLDFASLRHNLPTGNSLVLFTVSQQRVASDFASNEAEQRSQDLYAFVLPSADAPVRAVRLGELDAITRDIDAWDAALADRDVAVATVEQRGRVLREKLWQPLMHAGAGDHWLVLSTGSLYRMPWAALPDADGYLAERGFRAHELNHERELHAHPAPLTEPRLLTIADPIVGEVSSLASRRCATGLSALPGARRESAALAALWQAHFGDAGHATALLGSDATEANLRASAGNADILHFGTHGISLATDCDQAPDTLALRGFTLAADAPLDPSVPALTSSALLLSTGNARDSDDDGVLTAEEIAALDLSHARWAVLAACDTASGATHRYEGLFGLARAFRLAGAHTVLTSLWPVDDTATAEWTQALYAAHIEQGLDTAASMAAAQRSVLAARRARGDSVHPYYWAAFVASGDWR